MCKNIISNKPNSIISIKIINRLVPISQNLWKFWCGQLAKHALDIFRGNIKKKINMQLKCALITTKHSHAGKVTIKNFNHS